MERLEQSRVEPVLLRIATIDAVTNSEQSVTRSILHSAFRHHLFYTGQVTPDGFSERSTLLTTACNITIFGLEFWANYLV